MECDQCNVLYINGIKCHEQNCPNIDYEPKECNWCGNLFNPDKKFQRFCCQECCDSYYL